MKRVSIVIPSYGEAKTLKDVVNAVFASSYKEKELIVVNNGISNEQLDKLIGVKVVGDGKNLGVAAGRNLGAKASRGDYILFLDHDVILDTHAITRMVDVMEKDHRIGVVGPQIFYRSSPDTVWWSGGTVKLPSGRVFMDNRRCSGVRETDVVPAAIMVRREVFERVGGFYEKYFLGFEDSDFCLRVKKNGYRVVCACEASAYHDIDQMDLQRIFRRIFFIFRNRTLFIRRNASKPDLVIYLLFYNILFMTYYSLLVLRYGKVRLLLDIIRGTMAGMKEKIF